MKKGQVVFWRNVKAFIRRIDGEIVTIQMIENPGKGNVHEVSFKELTSYPTYPKKMNPNSCPQCGTEPPDYYPGLECPQCHFKIESFRKYIEMFQPALPFMQKEKDLDPAIYQYSSKDDYVNAMSSGGHKTELGAEKEVSPSINGEKTLEVAKDILPGITFIHVASKKLEYGEKKERILAFKDRDKSPIGGLVIKNGHITDVWTHPDYKSFLYKELRKYATLKGYPDVSPEELTSKSFRAAQAKHDWSRR